MNKKTQIISTIVLMLMTLVSVSALTISSVDTTPNQIMPGEDAEIKIVVENKMDSVKDVSVKLDLTNVPLAPYDSSSEKTVDEIEEDDKQTFRFKLIALNDADSGIYKIPVEIKYKEDGEIKTRTGLISLIINSVPEMDVQIEDAVLLKGRKNELTMRIINKGLSDVKFLEIEILPGSYSILSQKKVYIGEITRDDFDTAEYKIYFKENSPGLINLPVVLRYKDITNKQYTKNYNLQIRVYDTKEAVRLGLVEQSRIGTYVIGAVILIVLWIVYRKIRKIRKARKAKQEV